jgi:hypothetical protein
LVRDLRFASDAPASGGLASVVPLASREGEGVQQIIETLRAPEGSPLDYIKRLLYEVVRYLGLRWNVIRSSALNLSGALRAQDRVLEIIRMLGARRYVNAPGERGLYGSAAIAKAGIELHFLPEYRGPLRPSSAALLMKNVSISLTTSYILWALIDEPPPPAC